MISETRSIYFRHILNSDGTITAESFFKIKSDAETADEARSDAAQWAGVIGEPLRIGGGGYNLYAEHPDFVLDAVDIKQLDHEFIFDVRLTGRPRFSSWQLLPGGQRIEENNTVTETKEYSYCGSELPSYPHEGEIIVADDGKRMVCSSSKITDEGANHKKLTVVFKSFNEEIIPDEPHEPESPSIHIDKFHDTFKDNVRRRKAVFYWTAEVYNSKMAELRFHDETYIPDWAQDGYVLEKMECTPDDTYGYFVELTARKIVTELVALETEERENGNSVTAVYTVKNSDKEKFSNLIGTVPAFASDKFIITGLKHKVISPALTEITVYALERAGEIQLGDIVSESGEYGTGIKKSVFFAAADEVASYRENLQIGSVASWAGDKYYLESFTEKENAYGSTFELKASEIYTRMLSMSQEEKFTGFANDGTPCREVIYTSVWQVRPEDLSEFFGITGTNAGWCSEDAIITEVKPKQQSPLEYRVTIKAESRSNPELHKLYNCENYTSLSNRVDLDCELADFRFSPKDCGYYINSEGLYELIPGWLPASECPIVTDDVLHPRYINAIVKILRISESIYIKGSMNRAIDDMIEWNAVRVFNGRVGNYSGSYLKNDLKAKEIYDSHGVQWTKITRIYDMAPDGAAWSPYYFRKIGK